MKSRKRPLRWRVLTIFVILLLCVYCRETTAYIQLMFFGNKIEDSQSLHAWIDGLVFPETTLQLLIRQVFSTGEANSSIRTRKIIAIIQIGKKYPDFQVERRLRDLFHDTPIEMESARYQIALTLVFRFGLTEYVSELNRIFAQSKDDNLLSDVSFELLSRFRIERSITRKYIENRQFESLYNDVLLKKWRFTKSDGSWKEISEH